jgi:hypothetical protein
MIDSRLQEMSKKSKEEITHERHMKGAHLKALSIYTDLKV